MATKKNPITDPTGEKVKARASRNNTNPVTNSTDDETVAVDSRVRAKLRERFQSVAETAKTVGDTAKTVSTAVGTVTNAVGNVAESIGLAQPGKSSRELQTHNAYGGLTIPVFNPGEHLATNLFNDSGPLPRTKKADADAVVESIEEKRQSIRIVSANLDLNTDIIKAGTKSEKMTQAAVDYGIAKVNTDSKLIDFDSSLVSNEIAATKLDQNREKLAHEQVTLEGLRNETDQRKRFWQEKYQLGESRIRSVQLARYQLDLKIGSIDTEASTVE